MYFASVPVLTIILASLLSMSHCLTDVDIPSSPNISFYGDPFLSLNEGQSAELTFSLQGMDPTTADGFLRIDSRDEDICEVRNLTEILLNLLGTVPDPANFTTVVEGLSIGITYVDIFYSDTDTGINMEGANPIASYKVKVKHVPTILNPLFSYLVLIWLIISYIMMGSTMQWKDIWERLKKPWVLLLAMGCQFFVMPALAYALSLAFKLDNVTSLGLIMVGTCPGGWLSNIFSLLLDCDFILSLTMTLCSTILAMGMMPFNLWLYARPLTIGEESLETPYLDLFLQIIYLVIPVGLSMLVARFSKRFRKYCEKLLKPVATLCILVAVGLGIPAQLHIYQSATAEVYAVSALLPFCGSMAGLLIAKVCCLERRQAVTVSLETGAQNSLLAVTMLAFFYPFPEADIIGKVPYIMALLSLVEGIIVTVIYMLSRHVFCKDRFQNKNDDDEEDGQEQVNGKLEADLSSGDMKTERKEVYSPDKCLEGGVDIPIEDVENNRISVSKGIQVDLANDVDSQGYSQSNPAFIY